MNTAAIERFDEWWDTYRPIRNKALADSPFDGYMFETFGDDFEGVAAAARTSSGRVWTLIETSSGAAVIVEGLHFVNRLGYFITIEPARPGLHEIVCYA